MMYRSCLSAALAAAVPAMIAPALADTPAVYPTPQQAEFSGSYVRATHVIVRMRAEDASGELWQGIPADVEGAYGIRIAADGTVEVYANDDAAVFYAKQTLSQLLRGVPGAQNAQADPFPDKDIDAVARLGDLPVGTIRDWPDIRYRGTVEGYYGIPWSYEARRSQFAFYGRNKMNFYIYAPKDDPLHHGEGCYAPYPEQKRFEIASLVRLARENHVHFVWAIHPANTVDWSDDNGKPRLDALCAKLQMMYELGVRDFGVLVDDSMGEIGKVERQVQLTNYIVENFIRKHPDVNQEMIMCPTGYNRSWTKEQTVRALGEGLAKGVMPMWTGNTVVCDITLSGQQWVTERLQRPNFIWWNWPCNDMKPSRLSMGRTYGLGQEPDIKKTFSGFVSNPMERAEASKVALFGVADYTWNIGAFDSVSSWKTGIRRLYPQCAAAMQLFCNHNSDLLPNNHGYAKEESVDLIEAAAKFRDGLASGKVEEILLLRMEHEFRSIRDAGNTLRDARGLSALQSEIAPWLRAFTLTGEAGVAMTDALQTDDLQTGLELCFVAGEKQEKIASLLRDAWQGDRIVQISDVQVGSKAVTPALLSAQRLVNARLYAQLSGHSLRSQHPAFSTNHGEAFVGVDNMLDIDASTAWSSGVEQQAGDWVCMDLGERVPLRRLYILLGGGKANLPYAGQVELSDNGENWTPLGDVQTGRSIAFDMQHAPAHARYVRYRITEANPQGQLRIQTFSINGHLPASISATMEGLKNLSAYSDSEEIALVRVMEVAKAQPGSYVRLSFPTAVMPKGFELNFNNDQLGEWGELSVMLEDGRTQVLPLKLGVYGINFKVAPADMPKEPIKGICLRNKGSETQEIRLSRMAILLPEQDPEIDVNKLRDGDLSSAYNCGKAPLDLGLIVPEEARELVIIGTAECTLTGAELISADGSIRCYRLKPDCRKVEVHADQQSDKRLYEFIFR
ncbi:MAG: beta-N-acetylglucosaminidase domain-containing protein [Akkermansia sp.]